MERLVNIGDGELFISEAGQGFPVIILRVFAEAGYGGIEVEDRLGTIDRRVLVLAGRHDRTCSVAGAQAIADGIPGARLVVFEESAHMMYVEEPELYRRTVRDYLAPQA